MEMRASGSFFSLDLLGYEYPDAEGEPYDANWLQVRVDVAGPQGAWSITDPCLLTYEVARLADWLDLAGSGQAATPAISFLEPALLFRLIERERSEKVLRIHFGNLAHPNWAAEALPPGKNPDLWVDFPLAEIDLPSAAQSLRAQLKKFPRRYER